MIYEYNDHDLKILNTQKSPGRAFALLVLGCSVFITFILLIVSHSMSTIYAICILSGGVFLACLTYLLINKTVLKDIKECEFKIERVTLLKKEIKTDYEVGSGSVIFSMRPFRQFMLHISSGEKLNVEESIYHNLTEGDNLDILYAKNSKIRLRVEKARKS